MVAAFGSIGRIDYGSRTNSVVPVPAGTTDGNLLLLCAVTGAADAVTPSLPAGWTQLGVLQSGADAGSFDWVAVMGVRIASSEPASYTVTHAAAGCEVMITRFTGSGTLSVDAFSQGTHTADGGTTTTAPSVSPTVADALLVFQSLNWDEVALTPPTGMTERQDSQFLYLATQALAAAGATGTRTQPHSYTPWFGNLIAIKDEATGGPTQTITAARLNNGQTFFGATVAPGAVTIAGTRFNNPNSFPASTVKGVYSITGSRYNNPNTFFAAAVSSEYEITAARLDNPNSFFGATVAASYDIEAARFNNPNTFFGATLSTSVEIEASRLENPNTFFSAIVGLAGGPQTINAARLENLNTFPAATVRGSNEILTARLDNAAQFFGAAITATYDVHAARLENSNEFFSAIVSQDGGPQTIVASRFSNPNSFFAASVKSRYGIETSLLVNPNAFFAATITSGEKPEPFYLVEQLVGTLGGESTVTGTLESIIPVVGRMN